MSCINDLFNSSSISNSDVRAYNEQLIDKFYTNISNLIDTKLNDFSKKINRYQKKKSTLKCNHLNKLTRLNDLIDLNPKYKFKPQNSSSSSCYSMTPSSIYPEQENSQDQTINSNEDLSSINQDPPVENKKNENDIEYLKENIIPVLSLSSKQTNVILVWNLFDEITQETLTKNHPIFEKIKGYEIYGHKRPKIKQESDSDEYIDSSKWLSLGAIKSKTTPSQVCLKDFQKGTFYFFTIRIQFNDNSLGKQSKAERISFD